MCINLSQAFLLAYFVAEESNPYVLFLVAVFFLLFIINMYAADRSEKIETKLKSKKHHIRFPKNTTLLVEVEEKVNS